jgi:hypothetical protein
MTVKEQRKLEYRKEQTERRDRKKWRWNKSNSDRERGKESIKVYGGLACVSVCHVTFLSIYHLKFRVVWHVAPCILIGVNRRFRGADCFHHQGDTPLKRRATPMRLHCCTSQKTTYSPPWESEISHSSNVRRLQNS